MKVLVILFLTVVTLLLFIGCAGDSASVKSSTKKVRFQSVPAQKVTILQNGKDKISCVICGMHLPTFYKTNHVADTKYGVRQYCSIHCVVEDNEINHTDLANLRVVDTNSLKFIPAESAFYVVGSEKQGTMSRVSKYAFEKEFDAKSFSQKFGGEVMKFYDAYAVATKDFTKRRR